MLGLGGTASGRGTTSRPAPWRTRGLVLAGVLALSLTLNASEAFTTTVSRATIPPAAAAPGSLTRPPGVVGAALYADVAPAQTPDDEARTVEVTSPKGTRTWSASSLTDSGLPSAARRAYVGAAESMAGTDPACQVPWTLLAGIGRIESDHGRYGGSVLGEDGVSHPLIIGVALNGAGPVAAIRDTDDGRLDKDTVWDRAVGPMQFLPSTWAEVASDGDGDGTRSPNDIDDAALGAAAYLCSGTGSVLGESAMRAAIFRYNASRDYVALVMAMEEGYRTGVFVMPAIGAGDRSHRPKRKTHPARQQGHRKHGHRTGGRSPGAAATPSPAGPGGQPSGGTTPAPHPPGGSTPPAGGGAGGGPKPPPPKPQPSPPPTPATEERSGTLAPCGAGWCLDAAVLDLGGDVTLGQVATHDYDNDKATGETNQQELEGLSGGPVTVVVKFGTLVVTAVQGLPYP